MSEGSPRGKREGVYVYIYQIHLVVEKKLKHRIVKQLYSNLKIIKGEKSITLKKRECQDKKFKMSFFRYLSVLKVYRVGDWIDQSFP